MHAAYICLYLYMCVCMLQKSRVQQTDSVRDRDIVRADRVTVSIPEQQSAQLYTVWCLLSA